MAGKKAEEEVTIIPIETGAVELMSVMEGEAHKRELVTAYIAKHMKKDVDFGTIKVGGRDSKPSLFKPGSEKFMSLFKLTARFKKDAETWEMLGSESGMICYLCELVDNHDRVVGEGRGVSSLKEKTWTPNAAVKIAEKRAQIDAVLRTGALSDFFTQDLEDLPAPTYTSPRAKVDYKPLANTEDPLKPIDIKAQRDTLRVLFTSRGVDVNDRRACERFVADETQLSLTESNYGEIIRLLNKS